MCYGSCRDSEIDKINTALAGFLDNQGEQGYKNVKQYIDDLIGGKDASVTGVSSDGHVTVQVDEVDGALTAAIVTTNDIASLSATTRELDAIETAVGLNADGTHKQSTGTYTSAATTIEGEIVALDTKLKEVADQVSDLDAASVSGESKVVIDVTQEDGQITATAANLTGVKLDGYTEGSDAKVAAADTLGEALGKLQGQINAMDKDASAVAGQVVTTVAEEDGKVTETKANVKDLQLGGYVKDTTATGDIAGTDTINAALSKLENKAAAITIANADGSINVTAGAAGTDINVNIKSGEHVLAKDGNAGLYTDLDLVKITTGLPATVKERYQILATDDSQIGVNIDVPKDSHIVSINYITTGEHAQNLEYVYIDVSGQTQTTYVDMSELVLEAEFASGVTVNDHIVHGVVDPTSESFLTVGANGFKVSGVQDAIDAKVNALDVTDDTAVAGQYVAAIEQTDGVVAVKTRANVSEAVLTNYSKGTDATAVAATDTVNQAIGKLENQVDKAKAAATTKVVEGTDAGNNMEIVPTTGADSSVTYTVNLTDVASKTALDAEIAARKAVDGQTGQTYAANTGATYISGASNLNDADVKLDAALKAVADRSVVESGSVENYVSLDVATDATGKTTIKIDDTALKTAIEAMDLAVVSGTGAAIVSVSEEDGKVSATTGNVDTDHVVLASGLTGTSVSQAAGTNESTVLQQIVNAIDNLGGNALTAVTSTGNTLSVGTPSGNEQNIEFLKETATDTTVADGHLGLAQNANHEWYGVMYWINEEETQSNG